MDDRDEREFSLGDKTYPAKLTMRVFIKANEKTLTNYVDIAVWRKPLMAADIVALIWALTGAHERGDLSFDAIADTLTPGPKLYELHGILMTNWRRDFAEVDRPEAGDSFASANDGGGREPASTSA